MSAAHKVLLIILDGWGIAPAGPDNAIAVAATPFYDELMRSPLATTLQAAGEAVGLPPGQMGTSEVNHLTIGAGRIVFQDLVKINKAIADKSFYHNQAFIKAFEHVKKNRSTLHIQGLLSPGGVHSHENHIFSLLEAAKEYGLERVYLHVFTDGRDTLPQTAKQYAHELEEFMAKIGLGQIASISGRYYAMDRDHNWERTDKTFDVLQGHADAAHRFHSIEEAIDHAYAQGLTDEFIEPALIEINNDGEVGAISTHDAVIFANFRNDRTRQLTERILDVKNQEDLEFVTMTKYKPDYQVLVAFEPENLTHTLGQVLADEHKMQLRVTETEKFAHLTFFFNAKRENAYEGEDRMMIDSYSDIKTHDEKPQMRAPEITRRVISELKDGYYDFIATNLCNADMVGHSGKLEPTVVGIETIDQSLAQIVPTATANGYHVIITADHGNAEELRDPATGAPKTSHTTNPVPFILVTPDDTITSLTHTGGLLSDIAPTILTLMDVPVPAEMTGQSLVEPQFDKKAQA